MTGRFRRDLPFGATLIAPDRTAFRLFAPAQSKVTVEIEGAQPVPMRPDQGGWFEAEAACGAGARYRFRLASGEAVPDPASRAQAGDVHDPSVVVDPQAYEWRHPDWQGRPWREAVLYELHVGVFGGFAGVARKLPWLADLGVTAIELMPIADFPGRRNWGYDGVLPFAPDATYGKPDELKALIDTAHARGLMVFLDVVYNHFGPEGNYLAAYAPQFFRDDIATPWGPAIDFRQEEVRRFFAENSAEIVPRLTGARSLKASVLGSGAVKAAWRLGDASVLTIAVNLGAEEVAFGSEPPGRMLFESAAGAGARVRCGVLPARSAVAFLEARP